MVLHRHVVADEVLESLLYSDNEGFEGDNYGNSDLDNDFSPSEIEVSTKFSEDIETDFLSILVARGRSRARERPGRGRRGGARGKQNSTAKT